MNHDMEPRDEEAGTDFEPTAQEAPRQGVDYMIPASILLSGIIIAGAIVYVLGEKSGAPSVGNNLQGNGQVAEVVQNIKASDRDVVLGQTNAPVSIVEYGDYQCPFCERFFTQTESQIRKQYIESGKAKMVFRNFTFLGPESLAAAEAAECAKDQKQFWAFHDAIYVAEGQDGRENNGNLTKALFMKIAGTLKLDTTAFEQCIDSHKYTNAVKAETDDAQKYGVNSTPTTFVNDQKLLGALPFEQFQSVIDGILNK